MALLFFRQDTLLCKASRARTPRSLCRSEIVCVCMKQVFCGHGPSRGCVHRDNVISVTAAQDSWIVSVWG